MKLHEYPDEFKDLISIVAARMHLPESAIERDYYIVLLLSKLQNSEYCNQCVFKGGTSLSKCYPGSIDRFSEDIDLTFLGMEKSDKMCDKTIKKIEEVMTESAQTEKINSERSLRSKSMYVWFGDRMNRVKLEIGSSVRPDPYEERSFKSYIHEFLESLCAEEDIIKYELKEVSLNVLRIERTFVDKLMSVKRHTICGTIGNKVRHIYDVTRLYRLDEIQAFLSNKEELRRLIRLTKETDSYYLEKRSNGVRYDPRGAYDFDSWKKSFPDEVREIYESLHKTLLYTDEKQNWLEAIETFDAINRVLMEINE